MPLLGHLFSGLTAGAIASAGNKRPTSATTRRFALNYLLPLSVAGAYLPDILSQTLLVAGYEDGQHLGHSLFSAFPLVAFWAFLLSRGGIPPRTATAVSMAGILFHLILDALQSPDHLLWWPLSAKPLVAEPLLPSGILGEAIVALAACTIGLGLRLPRGKSTMGEHTEPFVRRSPPRTFPAVLVILVGVAAGGVFVLRESRERDLERARQLIEIGRVEEGFALLDAADRWPAVAKSGRVDYYRGVGHLQRGRRAEAEASFLKSYREDPRYLWVVFDLAVFYAEAPLPVERRRDLAEPFLHSLAADFPGRPEALRGLERARRRLEQ